MKYDKERKQESEETHIRRVKKKNNSSNNSSDPKETSHANEEFGLMNASMSLRILFVKFSGIKLNEGKKNVKYRTTHPPPLPKKKELIQPTKPPIKMDKLENLIDIIMKMFETFHETESLLMRSISSRC